MIAYLRILPTALPLLFTSVVGAHEVDDAALEHFERSVRPVLIERCTECHGPGLSEGGLRLDDPVRVLRGADDGPVVIPGDPGASRILTALRAEDPAIRMPRRGEPLSDEELTAIERWIQSGAPIPEVTQAQPGDLEALKARMPWIWTPPLAEPEPAVRDTSWPRELLDHFVLARLEAEGLEPAPEADRATWLRRVSFALIGLPPTPAELAGFLEDQEQGAHERVVDRLLASPHFGERWARHWMDLVRYAESRGHESDFPIANAWQYRDYLIRAFNADLPYDQFVLEHLAGDLLQEPRRNPEQGFDESVLGTGWAYLGEEVHSPVDIRADEADRIDNKLDVLSKTFLGITLTCARCHDHKFDAIAQEDYYALSGFFRSTTYRQVRFDSKQHNQALGRELEELRESWRPRLARAAAELNEPGIARLDSLLLAAREVRAEASEVRDPLHSLAQHWNFEDGNPRDWRQVVPPGGDGSAFATPAQTDDVHTGILESEPFVLGSGARFRLSVSGGAHGLVGEPDDPQPGSTAVTLERETGPGHWEVLATAAGRNTNQQREVIWDVDAHAGATVRLRIYDTHTGGWGHVRVDDVRYLTRNSEQANHVLAVAAREQLDPTRLRAWVTHLALAAQDRSDPLHLFATLPRVEDGTALRAALDDRVAEWDARLSHAAETWDGARVLLDFRDANTSTWLPEGPAFGSGPVGVGALRLGHDATRPVLGVEPETAARNDRTWDALRLAAGTERESGSLGGWVRAGHSLRSPKVRLDSGRLFYLVRGAVRVYASVDSHVMVTGPLHGRVIRHFGTPADGPDDSLRWVEHDLRPYAGHLVHLEFTPEDGREMSLVAVVEADEKPADPVLPNTLLRDLVADPAVDTVAQLAFAQRALLAGVNRLLARDALGRTLRAEDSARLANWIVKHPELFAAPDAVETLARAAAPFLERQAELIAGIQVESRSAPSMQDVSGVDARLLLRGKSQTPAQVVPRALPAAFGELSKFPTGSGSGRLALAQRIVDPSNPLAARVITNRVWHILFGRGIVATVDNFGYLGERPTHPELLDRLAHDLVHEDHWSLKTLIRSMVLSSTWRMSSEARDPLAEERDPDDLWLHRMRVKRLEGEAIRDSILLVSGRFDPTLGGAPVPVYLTPFVIGRGRPSRSGPLDGAGRRSIYTSARRNFLPTMMLAFDTPLPFSTVGRRNVTNVPAQALVLMNDEFVHQQARVWAERVLRELPAASESERLEAMILASFGRPARAMELEICAAALENFRALDSHDETQVWTDLAHSLWNAKEFIFIR